jgi:vacuolar protein sorting-associated protein 13A/C
VFGVSDSVTKITGSIGKGLSTITMDKDYQSQRRKTMSRNKPKHALGGVVQGANSFASSITSGYTGLVVSRWNFFCAI